MTEPTARFVVILNRDLMFGSKISSAVKIHGLTPRFVRDTAEFVVTIREASDEAVLGIIDMNGAIDWVQVAALTADPAVATPLLGFGPHVDIDGRRAAKQAGMTRILSNGEFHRDTADMIIRYARSSKEG